MSEAAVHCGRCAAELAPQSALCEIEGRTEAEFTNPGGHRYRVRFVDRAPGAIASGPATEEATWFPGMTWQRMFCRSCTHHAGWLFRSRARIFCALIGS